MLVKSGCKATKLNSILYNNGKPDSLTQTLKDRTKRSPKTKLGQ